MKNEIRPGCFVCGRTQKSDAGSDIASANEQVAGEGVAIGAPDVESLGFRLAGKPGDHPLAEIQIALQKDDGAAGLRQDAAKR